MTPRKKLLIIGAGGLGRLVHDYVRRDPAAFSDYTLHGFLDTRPDLRLPRDIDVPVLGSPLDHRVADDEVFLLAAGDPAWRRELTLPLARQGADFIGYHLRAEVGARSMIGRGVFAIAGVAVSVDSRIGDFVHLDRHAILGHDVTVGRYSVVGAMAFLAGGVQIGEAVTVHPRATIASGVTIGDGAIVGLGAVVVTDVPPNVTVFGNPARVIHART